MAIVAITVDSITREASTVENLSGKLTRWKTTVENLTGNQHGGKPYWKPARWEALLETSTVGSFKGEANT